VRIDELLRAGDGPVFSFEFGPPRTPEAELALWQAVEQLHARRSRPVLFADEFPGHARSHRA
jgi:hypothetical protein